MPLLTVNEIDKFREWLQQHKEITGQCIQTSEKEGHDTPESLAEAYRLYHAYDLIIDDLEQSRRFAEIVEKFTRSRNECG